MEGTLRVLIERNLSQCMHSNAVFLCERLHAHAATAENTRLLALCYYRSGRANAATALLRASAGIVENVQNRYLFAVCCFELGNLREAEDALLLAVPNVRSEGPAVFARKWFEPGGCPIPGGAAGLHLLGLICKKDSRRGHAVDYLVLSLKLDSFLWASYEELCSLGENIAAEQFFGGASFSGGDRLAFYGAPSQAAGDDSATAPGSVGTVGAAANKGSGDAVDRECVAAQVTPSATVVGQLEAVGHTPASAFGTSRPIPVPTPLLEGGAFGRSPPPPYRWTTPCATKAAQAITVSAGGAMGGGGTGAAYMTPAAAGLDACRGRGGEATRSPPGDGHRHDPCMTSSTTDGLRSGDRIHDVSLSTRKVSGRLFSDTPEANIDGSLFYDRESCGEAWTGGRDSVNSLLNGTNGALQEAAVPSCDRAYTAAAANRLHEHAPCCEPEPSTGGAVQCLALLRCLGNSLRLSSQYQCADAVALLEGRGVGDGAESAEGGDSALNGGLDQAQFNTGWVLRQCGLCYYEMSEYSRAKKYFEAMRRTEPYRVDGLEVYSTVLWHLKARLYMCTVGIFAGW